MSGTFYWRGLFVAPIFRFLLCVRAHTRFSIFHPTDRIVPFAPPSGTATLPVFATRSPISPSRSTLFRAAFPPSRTPSFPHSTILLMCTTLPRLSSICVGLHLVTPLQASSLPQTSVLRADSRFAKRIQRTRVICFPVHSSKIEDAEENLRRILEVAYVF